MNLTMGRVATTYGEQRIRIFIFPDGKHLPKNILNMFLHREFTLNTAKILKF